MLDVILADETQRPDKVEVHVIKAEAGAGKSVLLRRLAWETAIDADLLTLYAAHHRELRWEPLQELSVLAKQRIFLFVDDVAEHVNALDRILSETQQRGIPLTIIAAESYSLWQIYCARLNDFVTSDYPLRNLSETEIEELVSLLEKNGSLGVRLERMTPRERVDEFLDVADRQLLVALHEATQGEPLEVIVEREYRQLRPKSAQALYLTACVLNRLQVPVRAGLISRVHGVPFQQFKEELLGPLDHVVKPYFDPIVKDYMYKARHPHIADLIFQRVLNQPDDRFREYSNLLTEMNIAYRTDELAFEGMMKGKSIVELFPDYDMAIQLYKLAESIAPHHGELFHQRAIFEIRRTNPSTTRAYEDLEKAWEMGRDNPSVKHTFSELALVQADASESALKKEKYWDRAESLAASLLGHQHSGRYARHTLVKIGIARLKYALSEGHPRRILEQLIANTESHLEKGRQHDPSDTYLAASEADLRELLQENNAAVDALLHGFRSNPRDSYVASRLAKAYESQDKLDEALDVVETCLRTNRSNRQLNYQKAMILRKKGEEDTSLLLYFLERSFNSGDHNYDAQFWCARYYYESQEPEHRSRAKQIFASLKRARVPYATKMAIRDQVGGEGGPRIFHGVIRRLESTYGYIELDSDLDWLFVHSSDISETDWESLSVGMRVTCHMGFKMRGPSALEVKREL